VNAQLKAYIEDKLAVRKDQTEKSMTRDILDLALLDPEYGPSASVSELVDQLKTFLFAGHDTTASTISWAYYFLSHNPTELLRLRKELDQVFGLNTTPSQVAKSLIDDPKLHGKLDFTFAVIKETLRLEPPAASARETMADYQLTTSSGTVISCPQGAMVYTSAWMLHRDPIIWGEDAEQFRPERFMPGHPYSSKGYMAFSKRPRDCIGSNLAYLEVYLLGNLD
jgi:cytochrome P450